MTELDLLIEKAMKNEGQKQDEVNKVYLALLRTNLYIPVDPNYESTPEEPFKPLFATIENNYFLPAFDSKEKLEHWAGNQLDKIKFVELLGRDCINGINDNVYFCLNIGDKFYKEFSPDEVKRLKMIVARIEQLKDSN